MKRVYAFSEGLARQWKPDAVTERLDHYGPLHPSGSATQWTVGFHSIEEVVKG